MDAFGDLLRGLRAENAVFGQAALSPPWALRFGEGAPLTLVTLLRGSGYVVPASGEPQRVVRGDTAVARGPFLFVDSPASVSGPVPRVEVRGGTHGTGPTALVSGAYRMRTGVSQRLLAALPPALVVPGECEGEAVLDFIAAEIAADRPGQQIVLDRLLDWLLVCTLRAWFDRPEADPPAWYRALGDPVVGVALRAMHDDPAHPWTVASLAARAGVSRATFAKRFTDLVGEPPLSYLAAWRMDLAADLLAEPGATITSVARRVGYADGFGFSSAFKRIRGVPPSHHRAQYSAHTLVRTPSSS